MKIKTTQLLLLLCFLWCTSSLQGQVPDSLAHYSIGELDRIYEMHKALGNNNRLLPYAKAAVAKAAKKYGKQDTCYARMLYNLGYVYVVDRKFDLAISCYKEAMAIQKLYVSNSKDYGSRSQYELYMIYYQHLGNYEAAKQVNLEILSERKKYYGEEHPLYARALARMSDYYIAVNKYEEIDSLFIKVVSIYKNFYGEKSPEYAYSLSYFGSQYRRIYNFEKA